MTNRDDLHYHASCELSCSKCDYFQGKAAAHAELREPGVPTRRGAAVSHARPVAAVIKTVLSATAAVRVDAPPGVRVSVRLEVGDG